ncbi:hypothetical protein BH20ACT2_BH20ACT2_21080 [soil metagenome]
MTVGNSKSIPDVVTDLIELIKDYARQETIDPLRHLGRFLGWGVAGAVTLGIGSLLVVVAVLRVLQTETGSTFTGNLSWAPYGITLVVAALVAGLSLSAISSRSSKKKRST